MSKYLKDNNVNELEEELESDIDEETVEHPFSTKNIKVTHQVLSLSSIISRLKYDEIDLSPDFQRNADLWGRKKMSRLIESILLRLPLPIFYFDVSNQDKWIVIDGLQRLSTIKKFIIEEKMSLGGLEFLTDLTNKKYKDLDRTLQRIIEETQIITYQVEAQTPREVKYSIFNRINTGGLTLTPQEIRQALNQNGNGVAILKEIVEMNEFKKIVNIRSKRMVDRELVLRFIAFKMKKYKGLEEVEYSLPIFLDKAMEDIDNPSMSIDNLREYGKELKETLIFLNDLFGENTIFNKTLADQSKTKTLNRSLFEIWTVLGSYLSKEEKDSLLENKKEIKMKYKELLLNSEFNDSITKGTNDKKTIKQRFSMLSNFLGEVLI